MSPSESELRAALHHGEGDSPDAGKLIAHAADLRRERTRRVNTVLAGTAGVALVGLFADGLTALRGDDSGASADRAGGAALSRPNAGSALPAAVSARGSASSASSAGTSGGVDPCPAEPAHYALPGGGGSGQFGSTDPLLPDDVTSLRLCGYPQRDGVERTTALVEGSAAADLVAALNAAPAVRATGRP